jgi:hypothetical protein
LFKHNIYLPVVVIRVPPIAVVMGVVPSDVVRLMSGESHRIIVFTRVVRLRFIAATPFTYGLFFLGIDGNRHFVRRSRVVLRVTNKNNLNNKKINLCFFHYFF